MTDDTRDVSQRMMDDMASITAMALMSEPQALEIEQMLEAATVSGTYQGSNAAFTLISLAHAAHAVADQKEAAEHQTALYSRPREYQDGRAATPGQSAAWYREKAQAILIRAAEVVVAMEELITRQVTGERLN